MTKSKKAKKQKMELLTVNLTPEIYEKFKDAAENTQIPMTITVRELITKWLSEYETKPKSK